MSFFFHFLLLLLDKNSELFYLNIFSFEPFQIQIKFNFGNFSNLNMFNFYTFQIWIFLKFELFDIFNIWTIF
jgi:hypothetical protein